MPREYFEDCKLGDSAVTAERPISERDVVTFASVSGDWMSIHTDAQFAAATPFGERIAHGILVFDAGCTMLMNQSDGGLLPRSTKGIAEVRKVRFKTPVLIGDSIRASGEIIDLEEIDGESGLAKIKGSIENQRGEEVVAFSLSFRIGRRPTQ